MKENSCSTEFVNDSIASNMLRDALMKAIKVVKPSNLIKNRLQIDISGNLFICNLFDDKSVQTSVISANLSDKDLFLIGFGESFSFIFFYLF